MITWHDGIHGEERSKRQRLAESEQVAKFFRRLVLTARVAYVACFVSAAVNLLLGSGWVVAVIGLAAVVGGVFGMYSAGGFRSRLAEVTSEVETRRRDLAEVQARIIAEDHR